MFTKMVSIQPRIRGLRDDLFALVPFDFDLNGVAATPPGVVWAQAAIHLAIREFNHRARLISSHSGIAVNVEAVAVGGSLAHGSARLGIYPPTISFAHATGMQEMKVVARSAVLGWASYRTDMVALDFPSDVDLQLEFVFPGEPMVDRYALMRDITNQVLCGFRETIFGLFGILVDPHPEQMEGLVPLGELFEEAE